MVGKVIRDYIEAGNKKLTVPGFGTFMRKDSGDVIFVDLLRKDDGKLRELVEDYGNYGEVEAMALVDRFIFETKNNIEKNGSAPVDGFGTMFLDDKGLYQFDYTPQAKQSKVKENPVQEQLFKEEKPAVETKPAEETAARSTPQPVKKQTVRQEQRVPAEPEPGRISERPEPRRVSERPERPEPRREPQRPTQASRRKSKKSKPDTLLIVAIVVAVIAIFVMIFGLSTGNMPFLNK